MALLPQGGTRHNGQGAAQGQQRFPGKDPPDMSDSPATSSEPLPRGTAINLQAPMLELHAAMRLSRLWRAQGRAEQSRQLLQSTYQKFTEGFATADLKDAKALLEG